MVRNSLNVYKTIKYYLNKDKTTEKILGTTS